MSGSTRQTIGCGGNQPHQTLDDFVTACVGRTRQARVAVPANHDERSGRMRPRSPSIGRRPGPVPRHCGSPPSSPPARRGRDAGRRRRSARRPRPRSKHDSRRTSGIPAHDGDHEMKLCVDCRWITAADDIQQSRCGHVLATHTVTSSIDGSKRSFQVSCKQVRLTLDGRDEEGKLWHPTNVEFE
jgi:hypothetical protein